MGKCGNVLARLSARLINQRDEQQHSDAKSSTSSQATARPSSSSSKSTRRTHKSKSSGRIIHAVGSHVHKSGQTTPVLLRDHVHAHDPATPPHSDDSKKTAGEAELNLDLQELGLEDSVIRPDLLVKLERIGSGGFKELVSHFQNHTTRDQSADCGIVSMWASTVVARWPFQSSGSTSARVS